MRTEFERGDARSENTDPRTVEGFGDEWERFSQAELSEGEKATIFEEYFGIFPWYLLPADGSVGADIGCGSGRWATLVAPRVAELHLIDASATALNVTRGNLGGFQNVHYHHAGVDKLPIPDESLDFAYSLGVLHHVPDTQQAMISIAAKLKSGAPFLVYLYYAFDNRRLWYRWLWRISELGRFIVSRLPGYARHAISDAIAVGVYWPLARGAWLMRLLGCLPESWPLAYYGDKSFYVMRTDALDRFGTGLEQRFTRQQIKMMLESAGFRDIRFSNDPPYWCAVGLKS